MSAYRVLLADGHAIFRESLKCALLGMKDCEVVGEAGDGLDLLMDLMNLNKLGPHLILLDLSLPNFRGAEAVGKIKMIHPDVKILIMSPEKDRQFIDYALSVGAEGYLVKTEADRELFSAIEKIRQGGVYVPPSFSSSANGSL
jgi:DNA-binding NarL/FixJ family response regulator